MKKLTLMMVMAIAATMTFTLTSCDDEDASIAQDLAGVWGGFMYDACPWGGANDYPVSYTEIKFIYNSHEFFGGYGTWVDYYDEGHLGMREVYATDIEWTVSNGDIKIHSVQDDQDFLIYNYEVVKKTSFIGEIESENGYGRETFEFEFIRSTSWNE